MLHAVDDNSSDVHDTLEDDQSVDHPGGIEEVEVPSSIPADLVVQGVKFKTSDQGKDDNSPMHGSSRGASISTSPEQVSDGVSVHSLPAVHTTESGSALQRSASATRTTESSNAITRTLPSPSRSPTPQEEGPLAQQQRRVRHRSTAEVSTHLTLFAPP